MKQYSIGTLEACIGFVFDERVEHTLERVNGRILGGRCSGGLRFGNRGLLGFGFCAAGCHRAEHGKRQNAGCDFCISFHLGTSLNILGIICHLLF